MEKSELTFEIGGFARHLTFLTTKDLLILNITEKEVLVRYTEGNRFFKETFFKTELTPYIKKPSLPLSSITF